MKAVVFAILAGLCWGLGEMFTKSVLHSGKVGPMTVVLVRALVGIIPAAIVYIVAYHILKSASEPRGWWTAPTPLLLKLTLGSAFLAGFAGVFFFYLGLAHGPISTVKPIAFTLAPAVAVLLGWLVLREPMNAAKGIGVVMVLAGIVLIAGFGAKAAAHPPDEAAADPQRIAEGAEGK
jgi:uncharacterized membrane protein